MFFLLMSAFPACVYHVVTVGVLEDTGRQKEEEVNMEINMVSIRSRFLPVFFLSLLASLV